MSILKSLLSPFIDFQKAKNLTPSTEITTADAGDPKSSGLTNSPQPVRDNGGTAMNKSFNIQGTPIQSTEYTKHFDDLIEEANAQNPVFQGTDLKEFLDSKIDVEAITDEGAKYKTAFNVLKRTGLTKQRLLSTGQEYINLIEHDLKNFDDAFKQQYRADVELKEALLKQKAEELQKLTERMNVLNKEMQEMSQQISVSRDKLNANKNFFMLAGENKKKELRAELQKIDQYFT